MLNYKVFNKFKRKHNPISITSKTFKRPCGSYISDDSEMCGIVSDYYLQLLFAETFKPNNLYKK